MKNYILLILFTLSFVTVHAQGKLDKAKEKLGQDKVETEEYKTSTEDIELEYYDEPESSEFNFFLIQLILSLSVDVVLANYGQEAHLHNKLSPYPYYDGWSGNYVSLDGTPKEFRNFRVDLMDHIVIGNGVYGNHLQVNLRPTHAFYIQMNYNELLEPNVGESPITNLSLLDLNFCYDRFRLEQFNLGWLVGVKYAASGIQKSGLNLGAQMEAFFPGNISFYGSYVASKINGEPVNTVISKLRYSMNRFMATAGYDFRQLADVKLHFFTMGFGAHF
jgi:hypothetical protein